MAQISCKVMEEHVVKDTCSEQDCTGSGDNEHCTTRYYCWYCSWTIFYQVPGNATHNATTSVTLYTPPIYTKEADAMTKLNEYKLGNTYLVWYDRTDFPHARWDEPDPKKYLIMAVCWSAVALAIVSVVGTCFYSRYYNSYQLIQ
jgi:hypothetical protein